MQPQQQIYPYTANLNLFVSETFCECSKSQKIQLHKFQWLYSDYGCDDISQTSFYREIFSLEVS